MKPHVEGPDFERMAVDRRILQEAREDRAEIVLLRYVLSAIDHTLTVHGKIDADTDLHKRVQDVLAHQ